MTFTRIILLVAVGAAASMAVAAAPTTDVRVLIDVSGSMKDNDPANLRVPALQLLNGLMPAGAMSGIWMFAESTQPGLAYGVVDEAWKRGAEAAAKTVHWRGQRTDIEAALRSATSGWQDADPESRRSVILLTDGMVDTGSAAESAASRARILEERIAALELSGAAVHAIALSANADHDLLRSLAIRTGGWYERAEDATQLERLFLRMFEKAAEPDTVPISGNRFSVDGSIDEMTVLVFRKPDGDKLTLIEPEGDARTSAAPGDGVTWRAGNGYDMVTISQPAHGQWQINGEVDPDNRVMVITDLKLEVEGLPRYVMPGTALPLAASLSEAGERVTREDFLHLVGMNTRQLPPDGEPHDLIMLDDGDGGDVEAADGRFGTLLKSGDAEGVVEVTVTADSGTFVREKRFSLEVVWPVAASIEPGEPAELRITPRADIIDADTLVAQAKFVAATGEQRELPLTRGEDGTLGSPVTGIDAGGEVRVTLSATTIAGETLEMSLPALIVAPLATAEPAPATQEEPAPVEESAGVAPEETEPMEMPPPDWTMAAMLTAGVNVVAGALLTAMLWWGARRRKLNLAACEAALSPTG